LESPPSSPLTTFTTAQTILDNAVAHEGASDIHAHNRLPLPPFDQTELPNTMVEPSSTIQKWLSLQQFPPTSPRQPSLPSTFDTPALIAEADLFNAHRIGGMHQNASRTRPFLVASERNNTSFVPRTAAYIMPSDRATSGRQSNRKLFSLILHESAPLNALGGSAAFINLHATLLQIGTWLRYRSRDTVDLECVVDLLDRVFKWTITYESFSYRLLVAFDTVMSIERAHTDIFRISLSR